MIGGVEGDKGYFALRILPEVWLVGPGGGRGVCGYALDIHQICDYVVIRARGVHRARRLCIIPITGVVHFMLQASCVFCFLHAQPPGICLGTHNSGPIANYGLGVRMFGNSRNVSVISKSTHNPTFKNISAMWVRVKLRKAMKLRMFPDSRNL